MWFLLLFATGPAWAYDAVFDAPQFLGSDLAPLVDAVSADVNRDGTPDLVVCGAGGVGFQIQQFGLWTARVGPTTSACTALTTGDFDLDGQVDVAWIDAAGTQVATLASNGTSWTVAVVDAADAGATQLIAADLDNDGDLDLTTAPGGVLRHHTNGRGSWTSSDGVSVGSVSGIQVVDVDRDGLLDIGVLDPAAPAIGVVITSTPGAGTLTWYPTPYLPTGFQLGDADVDHNPDITFWGGGNGVNRHEIGEVGTPGSGGSFSVAHYVDIDHDIDDELVVIDSTTLGLRDADISNPGVWSAADQSTIGSFTPTGSAGLDSADLDNDGDLDLVLFDASGVFTVQNTTPHRILEYSHYTHTQSGFYDTPTFALPGPFTGARIDDVVVGRESGLEQKVLQNRWPASGFFYWDLTTGVNPDDDGATADVDRDGDLDYVVLARNGMTWWFENGGDGTTWSQHQISANVTEAIALADVDEDGDLDVVAAESSQIVWYANPRGAGTWTGAVLDNSDDAVSRIAAGDVDRDGDPDILVGVENAGVHQVRWLEHPGDPAGVWAGNTVHTAPAAVVAVYLADADANGVLDLWVDADDAVTVLDPGADPSTVPWNALATTGQGGTVSAPPTDLDRDGRPDLVTAGPGTLGWQRYDRDAGAFVAGWQTTEMGDPSMIRPYRAEGYVGHDYPVAVDRNGFDDPVRFYVTNAYAARTAAAAGPDDGARASLYQSANALVLSITHLGRGGDAPLTVDSFQLRGQLDGAAITGTAVTDLVDLRLWEDADQDGLISTNDPELGLSVTSSATTVTVSLDASVAPEGAGPGSAPTQDWLLEVVPTSAGTFMPAGTLDLELRSGTIRPVTRPWAGRIPADGNAAQTVSLQIGNTLPTLPALVVQVAEGGEVVFDALDGASDDDGDALVLTGLVGQPAVGAASVEAGSDIRYIHDASEDPEVVLLVEISDGIETGVRLVYLEVQAVDDPPWAVADAVQTLEDQAVDFELAGGDVDDAPIFEVTVPPGNGQITTAVTATGLAVNYQPNANFHGADALTFVVHGGSQTSAPATVAITVTENLDDDDDGDGLVDRVDTCPLLADSSNADLDGDGLGDVCDDDDDGDGVPDVSDTCPRIPLPTDTGADDLCTDDDDGDGVLDTLDNCPHVVNTDQADLDSDLRGDACDDDDDGDLAADDVDNCPVDANQAQLDTDGDTLGDACDDDDDGDGVLDTEDLCPWDADDQTDTDRDGIGDACDGDADGDGVPTAEDCDDTEPAVWTELTFYEDIDGDGFGDGESSVASCTPEPPRGARWDGTDNCPDDANPDQQDTDRDGVGDACDDVDDSEKAPSEPEGCGCDTGVPAMGWWMVLAAAALARRRPRGLR